MADRKITADHYNKNNWKNYYRLEYGKKVPVGQYYDPRDEGDGGGGGVVYEKAPDPKPKPKPQSVSSGYSPAPRPQAPAAPPPAAATTPAPTDPDKRAEITKPASGLESTVDTTVPVAPVSYLTGNTKEKTASRFLKKKKGDLKSLFG